MFQTDSMELDTNNIIMIGHSFGGVSALYTAIKNEEKRIRAVIGIDPWLFPMDEKYLQTKI